ncbi:hypothetical protein D8I24_7051 [Cupriavidus necator H850]|nr:hypothetical protein D8I24_7051 [Cupriavidus necator H850]
MGTSKLASSGVTWTSHLEWPSSSRKERVMKVKGKPDDAVDARPNN